MEAGRHVSLWVDDARGWLPARLVLDAAPVEPSSVRVVALLKDGTALDCAMEAARVEGITRREYDDAPAGGVDDDAVPPFVPDESVPARSCTLPLTHTRLSDRKQFPIEKELCVFLEGGRRNAASKSARGVVVTLHAEDGAYEVCRVRRRARSGFSQTPFYEMIEGPLKVAASAARRLPAGHALEFAALDAPFAFMVRGVIY